MVAPLHVDGVSCVTATSASSPQSRTERTRRSAGAPGSDGVETGNRLCGTRLDYGNVLAIFEDTEISRETALKHPLVAREWIVGHGSCDCGFKIGTGALTVSVREQWPHLRWSLEFRSFSAAK